MSKRPKTNEHKCFVEADKYLAEHNTGIDYVFSITDSDVRLRISTYKLNTSKSGKAKTLLASHCPFCGDSLSQSAKASEL